MKVFPLNSFAPKSTPAGIPINDEIRVLKRDMRKVTAMIWRNSGSEPNKRSNMEFMSSKIYVSGRANCPSGRYYKVLVKIEEERLTIFGNTKFCNHFPGLVGFNPVNKSLCSSNIGFRKALGRNNDH